MNHFRNILHNFGFHRYSKKDIDEELKKGDPNILSRNAIALPEVKYFVTKRWNKNGSYEEARECFKLFDKREKDMINASDIKGVLTSYLDFPITENDIKDFVVECGGNSDGSGQITFKSFHQLYNQ